MLAADSPVITDQIASSKKKKKINRSRQLALYSENFAAANDCLKEFFFHLIRIFTNL